MRARTPASNPGRRGRQAARVVALALGAALLLASLDASAARLGGGRASGLYRPQVTRSAPVRPADTGTRNQASPRADTRGAAAAAAPSAAPRRSAWLGPLAGLAAGLGLGALFAHLGLAPALGSWLMVLLLALGGFALLRLLMNGARPRRMPAAVAPWPAAAAGPRVDEAPAWAAGGSAPRAFSDAASFDADGFVERARDVFLRLQQANDAGDLQALRDASTPDLYEQFRRDLIRLGDGAQRTEVLSLQAHMLEHVEHPLAELVSVRFSGLLRGQTPADAAETFDEVWHFTRPRDRSTGWLLAGIQPTA